ncbi:hypothetical protein [Actinoplanes sp. RD1]|uniref:hypothetical protein n=1 Tax=Actinoplanes sp. RD1 TaxID=3064538 RepID=UPI002742240E|nr:hypothetical protein [Actinoplanes sp. RD1]
MMRFRSATAVLLGAATLSGCTVTVPLSLPSPSSTSRSAAGSPASPPAGTKATHPVTKAPKSTRGSSAPDGPRIVSLRIARQPKCAEGTAVFRADPVPLVLEWKITGAAGGALSVDDPTGTPGTYGPVGREGSQEFLFSCAGEVGSTETHTYTLYTTGDGPVRSKTVTASATVLDKGPGTN